MQSRTVLLEERRKEEEDEEQEERRQVKDDRRRPVLQDPAELKLGLPSAPGIGIQRKHLIITFLTFTL